MKLPKKHDPKYNKDGKFDQDLFHEDLKKWLGAKASEREY